MKNYTCLTQKEILQSLLSQIDFDKYSMMRFRIPPFHQNRMKELEKLFNEKSQDVMYEKWHLIRKMLPAVNNKKVLIDFLDELEFIIAEANHKIENRKVIYNDNFFREFDVIYIEKYGISIYDHIRCHFQSYIKLLKFAGKQIEDRVNELENYRTQKEKVNLKFSTNQTKAACYFLLAEQLGIFYNPAEQKPLNIIFDGAQFDSKNGLSEAADLPATISRLRNGSSIAKYKNKDKKFKKEIIRAAEELINQLNQDKVSIYEN